MTDPAAESQEDKGLFLKSEAIHGGQWLGAERDPGGGPGREAAEVADSRVELELYI